MNTTLSSPGATDPGLDRLAGRRAAIEALLWPKGASGMSVWAVLDGARDPRIHQALVESRLEYRSLYAGRLPRELERVSPQLVELLPGHRLTARLLGEGWGQAWGVFLRIDDPSNLRHHLRKFLKVKTEDGRRLLFRWYDPRVLRVYLPTCSATELATVFGPLDRWFAETDGATSLLEFSRTPTGNLKVWTHSLAAA
jgi:hypothetical protein